MFEIETEFEFSYCVENCKDWEIFDETYMACFDCDDDLIGYEGCNSCFSDDDKVFCDGCYDGLYPANNGVGCTPCEENQYYYKDTCIDCDA